MKTKDPFVYNQIKIAKETLKMSDIGAELLGGMSKEQAKKILKKHKIIIKVFLKISNQSK